MEQMQAKYCMAITAYNSSRQPQQAAAFEFTRVVIEARRCWCIQCSLNASSTPCVTQGLAQLLCKHVGHGISYAPACCPLYSCCAHLAALRGRTRHACVVQLRRQCCSVSRTGADDAVVALRVLDAQLILDHPAGGGHRLRKAAGDLQQARQKWRTQEQQR